MEGRAPRALIGRKREFEPTVAELRPPALFVGGARTPVRVEGYPQTACTGLPVLPEPKG
jgi:hypothetical protein